MNGIASGVCSASSLGSSVASLLRLAALGADEAAQTGRPPQTSPRPTTAPPQSAAAARDDPACSETRRPDDAISPPKPARSGSAMPAPAHRSPMSPMSLSSRTARMPAKRPITFAINGGPGAGSAWLDLGALGPWRLPLDDGKLSPSATPATVPNAETWLDFTDLVFIDPPGTGYSRMLEQAMRRKTFYSRQWRYQCAVSRDPQMARSRTIGLRARNSSSAKATAAFARRSSRVA